MRFTNRDIPQADYLAFLGRQESQEIHWGDYWTDGVLDHLEDDGTPRGDVMPWSKTQNHFRLRPAELTVWAGINGHKKSLIVGQIMLWLAKYKRVCVASLEMQPETTLARMCRQAAGCYPSRAYAKQFMAWTNERICIYDQLDTVESDRILGMVHYAAVELRCAHIVLDSLSKVGFAVDDYDGQTKFVDRLQWAAKVHKCHVHLVHHVRKTQSETDRPGKFDIRGASQIADLADNVVICWKNKDRDEARQMQMRGIELSDKQQRLLDEAADQELIIAKQRHGEWEGKFKFWFHDSSLQITPAPDKGAMTFDFEDMPHDHVA